MLSVERTPDGRRLCVSGTVTASRDAVWDLLVDTRRWPEWGPSVREVDCDRRRITAGTTGRVRTPIGWVPFEIDTCESYRWTWKIAGVPATGHRVDRAGEASDADGCRVVFELPVYAAGYAPVCRRGVSRIAAVAGV